MAGIASYSDIKRGIIPNKLIAFFAVISLGMDIACHGQKVFRKNVGNHAAHKPAAFILASGVWFDVYFLSASLIGIRRTFRTWKKLIT